MSSFADVDGLAKFLGIAIPPERVDHAQTILDAVTDVMKGSMNQTIELVEDDVIEILPDDAHVIWLPERPVVEVTNILRGGTQIDGYETSRTGRLIWPRGSLLTWPNDSLLRNPNPAAGDPPILQVTYTHGYAETPPKLEAVCKAVAARAFVNPRDIENFMAGNYQERRGAPGGIDFTSTERRVMNRFRRRTK